jgi:hypothetical protein
MKSSKVFQKQVKEIEKRVREYKIKDFETLKLISAKHCPEPSYLDNPYYRYLVISLVTLNY